VSVLVLGLAMLALGTSAFVLVQPPPSATIAPEDAVGDLKHDVVGWPGIKGMLEDLAFSPAGTKAAGFIIAVVGSAIAWWSVLWLRQLMTLARMMRPTKGWSR